MNILFITANRVGDAALSTGVLQWLVQQHPDADFTIACGPYAAGLFRAVPRMDRLIILRKKKWNRHWLELWHDCAGTRWDLIVDLRNSLVTRLLPAKKKIYRLKNSGQHKVIENARALHLDPPPAPHLWLDGLAEENAKQLLPATRPLLALGPAANWPPKQWPVESFLELARKLTAADGLFPSAPILVIADAHEKEKIAPLLNGLADRIIPVIGQDLLTVAACLKECALFVGNDSGLMHMAVAMNIPTLGLFGPGQEEIYGPWGPKGRFVRTPEKREELLRRLPEPGAVSPNLMKSLKVEAVLQAAQNLLDKT